MKAKEFHISGRVKDRKTRQGIAGLRVEAWDKDLIIDDLLGSSETDADGRFEIQFKESYFKEIIFDRRPDLYFKVFQNDELLKSTEDSVLWNVAAGETEIEIMLDIPMASQTFKVQGTILEPDGTPVAEATVKAFDKNIRTETLLGEATTANQTGRYEITYRAEEFLQSGKKQPDLIVRVFNPDGEEIAFTKEPVYNARQIEEVNLITGNEEYKGPSEYERLMDTLSPLLKDLELAELTDDDVEFLAGKTGIASGQIVHLVLAARYAGKTELPPEIFYGLFRQNLPTSLPALLAQNMEIQEGALEAAFKGNIVPETIPSEQVLERFQHLVVDHTFDPLEPLPTGKTTIGELLNTVEISQEQQKEFMNLYVRREGTIEEFWQGLKETDLQHNVQELQYTLQLGVVTGNHLPLVQHLKQLDSISGLRDLAGLDFDEWKGMVEMLGFPPNVPGKDVEEQANNYAHTIVRVIEDAFPTAVITHKLENDNTFPVNKTDLVRFFNNNPDFEFSKKQIDKYLDENTSALVGIEDPDEMIRQLKSMDRLFRITPRFERYEAMKVLMENGFNSAQSIAMMGQRSFSTQYAEKLGNYHKAKAIYTHAAQMTAMTMAVHTKYSYALNQPGMYVLPDIAEKMQGIPDWETLFGSFKLCDCEHCKSVLSPAAYLVDLLAFLRNHNLKKHISGPYDDVNSALGVLSDRRPDIEHINLSCGNTNTPVPYVDLINEVLENAVSFNPAYYQTTGTADELGANPEYLNAGAYNTLAKAIYPWSQPFDLWTEEARTYLKHLGLSRYNLMETFRKNGENPTPSDLVLASEYLGLTTKEQEIITDSSPSEPWLYWGLQEVATIPDPTDQGELISGNWVDLLCSIPVFLEHSGLSYKELDELLNTRFVNPGRFAPESYQPEIKVCFEDSFCNIETATITNLNPEVLNKIHRFVRLWRKIGWTAKELDIVVLITTYSMSPEIDEPFLLKLWHLHRLHSDLKIPVINLLSFWSPISTDSYNDQIISLYDQLFLNKTTLNPEDGIFMLNTRRDELEKPNEQVSDHVEGIQAALGISSANLSLLLEESEVPDLLNIANLSHFYRAVTCAKALKLSIGDFLSVKKLIGIDPFPDPFDPQHLETTFQFVHKVQKIQDSDFSVSELDYLLRHVYRKSEGIAPMDDEIALVLGAIREGLQKIAEENSMVADPAGEITAARLAWLKWDEPLIKNIIATLNNRRDYATDLDALPFETSNFPEILRDRIYYDANNKKLYFTGLMSGAEIKLLLGLSGQKKYQKAIQELFEIPKTFISERMKAFVLPPFSADLENFPPEVVIPDELKEKIYYDDNDNKLFFIGWMTQTEKATLKQNAPQDDFCEAIDILYDAPFNYLPDEENQFLKEADINMLTDAPDISTRFGIILEKLLPYILHSQSVNLSIQKIADALNLDVQVAEKLLTHYVILPADYHTGEKAIEIMLSTDFAESNPNVNLTSLIFPDQFNVFILLHKIALIITKLSVTYDDLPLLFQKNPSVWNDKGWADLNFLPLSKVEDSSALFRAAEKLFDLFSFRDALLPEEPTLFELLNMAFAEDSNGFDDFLKALSGRSRWKLENLQQLAGWFGFDLSDFQHAETLIKLMSCFNVLKRLGVSAGKVCDWIDVPEGPDEALENAYQTARTIKQTAKAKYDNPRWLEVAKPLRDDLREKQRAAVVSYLITHYTFQDKTFKDSNDLYAHFLIDPEMNPCMMTSRLKLATGTVQLFIQRCLMNLEEWKIPNATIAQEWNSQWEWMKNYRVWEANRKIFLYPENWIEPELRDNKSPFFEDLENELLQNEVTAEHVEKGFLNYLEKLDAVARLEICGMYHEVEKEAPDNIGSNAVDTLHVFGRTLGIPHIYYYRRRIAAGGETKYWTPWKKVDLDIEGNHLIPVVWNRRLYLFWPVFTEKARKGGEQGKEPPKYWEIQMAWSQYRNGKWSAKKASKEKINGGNINLGILLTLSTNCFFFRTRFILDGSYAIDCLKAWFPWYEYEFRGSFIINSCDDFIEVNINSLPNAGLIILPPKTYIDAMAFSEIQYGTEFPFITVSGKIDSTGNLIGKQEHITVLNKTPNPYTIVYPHQFADFVSQAPFFYQDDTRTFLVTPSGTGVSKQPDIYDPNPPELEWYNPEELQVEDIERHFPDYYEFIPEYEHWEEMPPPDIDIDPPIIETTFPAGANYDETVEQPPNYEFYSQSAGARPGRRAGTNTLSLKPEDTSLTMAHASLATAVSEKTYRFETFYHPYVCEYVKHLNREGLDGLLQRPVQLLNSLDFFKDTYLPTDIVDKPYPYEDVDFEQYGAYSMYNWEIFFHAPLMVADRLSKNQRFAEAQKWFHYIFDPTDTSTHDIPHKYWKFRPFFEASGEGAPETLEDLLTKEKEELEKQVNEWRDNPFKPHLIARMRIVAYQKTVVMKYIDNLIAWGDQLFRRDTIESINEATQLYILAADILGKRPEDIPPHTEPLVKTFHDLNEAELDALSNTMVAAENYFSSPKSATSMLRAGDMQMFGPSLYLCCSAVNRESKEDNGLLYFCIPKNQQLLSYWGTVADRLFKIRHCMTIEGVFRQLPIFEPPIDPGLLVRAAAAGVDIGSALNDLNAPLPYYRFQYMFQKAIELCVDVRSLGTSLLSALEKKDAEEMALLRSGHEVQLLKAVRQIKKHQIDEAKETIEASNKALEAAEIRYDYYKNIEKLNANEKQHLAKLASAQILQSIGQGYDIAASIAHLIPELTAGICAGTTYGGSNIGSALRAYGSVYAFLASIDSYQANRASILGSHDRRWNDWKLQEKLAETEINQIEKQILAAEIRKAIAEKDLENHNIQIENTIEVNTFMKDKFTNQELYNWMVSQISTIYFQSYQMAYDIAKRVEKTFQHELGDFNASFVKFGYWDSLKKGLLSGEQLHYDLKRMETAFLDKNKREFELTRHISLAMLDPLALVKLKETGKCFVKLPETLFDLDYPGHYMRRIKSVSLTIPCITGPYTNVNCTLTLLNNSVRVNSTAENEEDYPRKENDTRFRDNVGTIQSIATSSGQNDSGVFELNFRDERYLPFEGAGAISNWQLELSGKWWDEDSSKFLEFSQFDFDTISDVIMHLRYTAREGGNTLKTIVEKGLQEQLNELLLSAGKTGLFKGFNIRHQFPDEWHKLKQNHSTTLILTEQDLPKFAREHNPGIESAIWLARVNGDPDSFEMSLDDGNPFTLNVDPTLNNLVVGQSGIITLNESFILSANNEDLEDLENLVLLIKYTLDNGDDL